jgi:hypothetical protein
MSDEKSPELSPSPSPPLKVEASPQDYKEGIAAFNISSPNNSTLQKTGRSRRRVKKLNSIKHSTNSELNETDAKENWRMVLMSRNTLIKHGRMGKPHVRKIIVNTKNGDLSWDGQHKGLNVKELVSVSKGKVGKPFKRDHAFSVPENLCLTLHFPSRDVCLEAYTSRQRDSFAEALQACSEYLKNNKIVASKYASKKLKKPSSSNASSGEVFGQKFIEDAAGKTMTLENILPDRAMTKHMRRVRSQNIASPVDGNTRTQAI